MAEKTFRVRACAAAPTEGKASPGDSVLIAGTCALYGAEELAKWYRAKIGAFFPERITRRCCRLYQESDPALSPERPGEVSFPKEAGITSLCIPGDGGILAALWDLSAAAGCGFELDLRKIPLRQETIEICEVLDANPYRLNSRGCLLMTARNGDQAKRVLEQKGIPCTVIGWMDRTKGRKLHSGEILTYLDFPAPDELGRFAPKREDDPEGVRNNAAE